MHPILRALTRHKLPVLVIVVEVAMACAVVTNTLYLLGGYAERVAVTTGMASADLAWIRSSGQSLDGSPAAAAAEDVAAARATTGVVQAAQMSALPLSNLASYRFKVGTARDELEHGGVPAGIYFWGPHAVEATGIRLVAGRDFQAEEHVDFSLFSSGPAPTSVLITQALARRLFGQQSAVGQRVKLQLNGEPSAVVVGVIAQLLPPTLHYDEADNYQLVLPVSRVPGGILAIRSVHGQRDKALELTAKSLYAVNGARVLTNAEAFSKTEHAYFRADRSMVWAMGSISACLAVLTAVGIVSVSNYWLIQRRRSIGIRRALGARKGAIIRYFLVENVVVVGAGTALGLVGAEALNIGMMRWFEVGRLPVAWLGWAALLLLGLGQLAVVIPALRASRINPGAIAAGE